MSGCGQGFEPQVKEYLAQVSSANSKVEIRQHAQLKKEYNSAENEINKVVWVHVHYRPPSECKLVHGLFVCIFWHHQ